MWTKDDWLERLQRGDDIDVIREDFIRKAAAMKAVREEMGILDQIFWESIVYGYSKWLGQQRKH